MCNKNLKDDKVNSNIMKGANFIPVGDLANGKSKIVGVDMAKGKSITGDVKLKSDTVNK